MAIAAKTKLRKWPMTLLVGGLFAACSSNGNPTRDGGQDGSSDAPIGDVASDLGVDRGSDRPADTSNPDVAVDGAPDGGADARDTSADVADAGTDLGDGGSDSAGPLTQAQAFTARAAFTLTPMGPAPVPARPLPTEQTLVVHIDPGNRQLTLGVRGAAGRVPVQSSDGVRFTTASPITLAVPSTFCGASVSYQTLSFTVAGDQLSGQGTGRMTIIDGDVAYDMAATATFSGTIDRTGPSFGPNLTGVDPLPDLFLAASEPLPSATQARMNNIAGTDTFALVPFAPSGLDLVVGFHKRNRALNYGVTYAISLTPGVDLANNPSGTPTLVTTAPLPAILGETGFEGAGETAGGVPVVTAAKLPPIAGLKSAVVSPRRGWPVAAEGVETNHFAARMLIASGDKVVRLALRPFGQFSQGASTQGAALRVAIPGANITEATLPANETVTEMFALPGGGQVYLGAVRTVEVALPGEAAVGTEIVVDLSVGADSAVCGLPVPKAGYIIDDLRIE